MKKFYMFMGQQDTGYSLYGDEEGNLNENCNFKVAFPITSYIKQYSFDEEKIKLYVIDAFQTTLSKNNYKKLEKEVNQYIGSNCEVIKLFCKTGLNRESLIDLFKTIYGTFEEDDSVYMDITFGYKPVPFIALMSLNYAKAFVAGFRVRKILYASYDFSKKDDAEFVHPIINVTSLFYINSMIETLGGLQIRDPNDILDVIMK